MTELRRTPLHDEHRRLGARLVPFAGYEMPVQYAGLVKEHHAVRTAAGIFDVSHMGEIVIEGPEAEALVDALVTADVAKLPDGKAVYCVACNERGTILDDLIVYRRGRDRFLVVCNASNREKIARHFGVHAAGRNVSCEDASDRFALLAVQGPKAVDVLRAAGADPALAELPSFRLTETTLAGAPVVAARTGYTGEDGFELFAEPAHAAPLFRAIVAAGAIPCGLGARDTLRLEARLSLYGNEIDEGTDPFEAGLGWVVKLDKARDFVGKAALREIAARGPSRKLVGFEMVGRGIARHGYPIVAWTGSETPGEPIGTVTSGSPSPTLDKNIGLGYVPVAHAEVGAPIGVVVRGKAVEAVVVKTPFYRRSA